MMQFPIKVPEVNAGTLYNWRDDEYASWEDHGGSPYAEKPARYEDGTLHVHEILERRKTQIIIESEAEYTYLIDSALNFSEAWDDRGAYRSALGRIYQRLLELEPSHLTSS